VEHSTTLPRGTQIIYPYARKITFCIDIFVIFKFI